MTSRRSMKAIRARESRAFQFIPGHVGGRVASAQPVRRLGGISAQVDPEDVVVCSSDYILTGTVTDVSSFTLPSATTSDYLMVMWAATQGSSATVSGRISGGAGSREVGTAYDFSYLQGFHDGGSLTYNFGATVLSATWVLIPGGEIKDGRDLAEYDGGSFTAFGTLEFLSDSPPTTMFSDTACSAFTGLYATTDSVGDVLTGSHIFAQEFIGASVAMTVELSNPGASGSTVDFWFTAGSVVGAA